MKKNGTVPDISGILNRLAEKVKTGFGYELSFQGICKLNSNIRIFVKSEKKDVQIGIVCVKRHVILFCEKKKGRRFHRKYTNPKEIISILTGYIETVFKKIYPNKKSVKKSAKKIEGISLILSNDIIERIKNHVFRKPDIECGGYLIGRLQWSDDEQNVIGYVDDIYHDDSVGSAAQFVFTSQYGLKAYSYCSKTYKNADGVSTKKIIGNYHSHGNFNAFFSGQDKIMIYAGTAPEFYMVFSPGRKEVTALFKNKKQQLFAIGLSQDNYFKYCEPTIPHIDIDYSKKGKV